MHGECMECTEASNVKGYMYTHTHTHDTQCLCSHLVYITSVSTNDWPPITGSNQKEDYIMESVSNVCASSCMLVK